MVVIWQPSLCDYHLQFLPQWMDVEMRSSGAVVVGVHVAVQQFLVAADVVVESPSEKAQPQWLEVLFCFLQIVVRSHDLFLSVAFLNSPLLSVSF